MEKIEKNCNTQELVDSLEKDVLKRDKYLSSFIQTLICADNNTVLSLDGEWGSGKTFFVKQADMLINYSNRNEQTLFKNHQYQDIDDEIQSKIDNIIEKNSLEETINKIKEKGLSSFYFNAWEHDDEENPILSIIYCLLHSFPNVSTISTKVTQNSMLDLVKTAVKYFTDGKLNIDSIDKPKDLLEKINEKYKKVEIISQIFDSIITENCNRLVIFIDELDRCIPTFSVKLLESLKQYVTDDRVIIVLSTNLRELSNTIACLYGNIDSLAYLDRFIDYKLVLPACDPMVYAKSIYLQLSTGSYWFYEEIKEIITLNHMSLRNQNRFIAYMKLFENNMHVNVLKSGSYSQPDVFLRLLFIPYTVGLLISNPNEYYKFINGNGKNGFMNYISMEHIHSVINRQLDKDEQVNYKEHIGRLYEYVFGENNDERSIGLFWIESKDAKSIKNEVSLLDGLASIE